MNYQTTQLFEQYNFADISTAFVALWKFNEPEKARSLDLAQWEKLYLYARQQEAKPSDYHIVVGYRWEGCYPKIDMNCAVFTNEHRLLHAVAEHPSWAEILGMDIVVEEEVQLTPQELAAGMFWKMTYYGIKKEENTLI